MLTASLETHRELIRSHGNLPSLLSDIVSVVHAEAIHLSVIGILKGLSFKCAEFTRNWTASPLFFALQKRILLIDRQKHVAIRNEFGRLCSIVVRNLISDGAWLNQLLKSGLLHSILEALTGNALIEASSSNSRGWNEIETIQESGEGVFLMVQNECLLALILLQRGKPTLN